MPQTHSLQSHPLLRSLEQRLGIQLEYTHAEEQTKDILASIKKNISRIQPERLVQHTPSILKELSLNLHRPPLALSLATIKCLYKSCLCSPSFDVLTAARESFLQTISFLESQPSVQQAIEYLVVAQNEFIDMDQEEEEESVFDFNKYHEQSSRFPIKTVSRLMPKLCRYLVLLHLACAEGYSQLKMLLFYLLQPQSNTIHLLLLKYTLICTIHHDYRVHQFLFDDYSNICSQDKNALLPVITMFYLYGHEKVSCEIAVQIETMEVDHQMKVLQPLGYECINDIFALQPKGCIDRQAFIRQDKLIDSLLDHKMKLLEGESQIEFKLKQIKFINQFILLPAHQPRIQQFYQCINKLINYAQGNGQIQVILIKSQVNLIQANQLSKELVHKILNKLIDIRLSPNENSLIRLIQLYKIVRILPDELQNEQVLPELLRDLPQNSVLARHIGLSAFENFINRFEGDLEQFFMGDEVRQSFVEYLENTSPQDLFSLQNIMSNSVTETKNHLNEHRRMIKDLVLV